MSITILSWDIGVSNLSYCLLQYKDDEKNIITKSKTTIDDIISNDKFINLKDITIDEIGNKTTIKHWGILDISGNIDDSSQDNYTFFSNLEDLKLKNEDNEITIKQMKGLGKKINKINKINEINNDEKNITKKNNKKETNKNKGKTKKKPKKKKYDINLISLILFKKLDELMDDISKKTNITNNDMIDYILIENQPSLKNPKMKTIQILVYSYFMIRKKIDINPNTISPNIQFISALGKLKYCKDDDIEKMFNHLKSKYTVRKKKGIEYCKKYMGEKDVPNNDFFESNKKKDDLADSYLQAVQFMFKTKK